MLPALKNLIILWNRQKNNLLKPSQALFSFVILHMSVGNVGLKSFSVLDLFIFTQILSYLQCGFQYYVLNFKIKVIKNK